MYSYHILYLMSYAIYFPLMMFAAAIINAPITTEHISIVTQIDAIVIYYCLISYFSSFNHVALFATLRTFKVFKFANTRSNRNPSMFAVNADNLANLVRQVFFYVMYFTHFLFRIEIQQVSHKYHH